MKTPPPSSQAIHLAQQTLDRARREVRDSLAPTRARTLGWQARIRDVSAGRTAMAALWLEALAVLGDEGAKRALELEAESGEVRS